MIYLDNNATTAIDPLVANLITEVLLSGPANPSSQHGVGRSAHRHIENALEVIADCLGTDFSLPGGPRLIFTSGGTESNNLALAGLGVEDGPLIISRIEHPSIFAAAEAQEAAGRRVAWLEVDSNGVVDIESLKPLIQSFADDEPVGLVSLMSANNETGVLQPI